MAKKDLKTVCFKSALFIVFGLLVTWTLTLADPADITRMQFFGLSLHKTAEATLNLIFDVALTF